MSTQLPEPLSRPAGSEDASPDDTTSTRLQPEPSQNLHRSCNVAVPITGVPCSVADTARGVATWPCP